MSDEYGLIHACLLDGSGGAKSLTMDEVTQWQSFQGLLWLHFDYSHPQAETWLLEQSGIDEVVTNALLMDETRPRATPIKDGLLIALRGINYEAAQNDMIALRIWIEGNRIITSRRRKLEAAGQIKQLLENHHGPTNSGEFLALLIDLIIDGITDTIDYFEEQVADYEDTLLDGRVSSSLRYDLANLRRQTITIRRYLAPQRDALAKLVSEKLSWLDETDRIDIRETSDRLIRHIENLDAVRERAALTQEELFSRISEQMNARMYVLSVVAAIFLPLSFLTGLLGVNIGGIPGSQNPVAFWVFCVLLVAIVVMQALLFRWRRWF